MARPKGFKHTEEHKRKVSQTMKGKKPYIMTDEIRKKMSLAKKGKPSLKKGRKFGPLSEEARRKIGDAHRGKPSGTFGKHWFKVKDRTKLVVNEKKHLDTKYKYWMLSVKKRDNWKCRIINVDCKGRLESHHILNWKEYPELRYEINNGITLCVAHHPRGRAKEKLMVSYFQELLSTSKE